VLLGVAVLLLPPILVTVYEVDGGVKVVLFEELILLESFDTVSVAIVLAWRMDGRVTPGK
jgi:hypothetical protein